MAVTFHPVRTLSNLITVMVTSIATAATITVTSTATTINADGAVTLPEAMTSIVFGSNVNSDVAATGTYGVNDTIRFNIPGAGVHTINLAGALPSIQKPLTIDGYSQPGSQVNTLVAGENAVLRIELKGNGGAFTGLFVGAGGDGTTIRGLVINGFGGAGIAMFSSSNTVTGNFIGTDPAGMTAIPNGVVFNNFGVEMDGFAVPNNASHNLVGGPNPADRNIISANFAGEVMVNGSQEGFATDNKVEGNFLGVAADGSTFLGTGPTALFITRADHSQVGGTTNTSPGGACTGACNVVVGKSWGIKIQGEDTIPLELATNTIGTTIQGNFVNVRADGSAIPTGFNGSSSAITLAHVNGGATIGGTTPSARNVVSGSEFGISVGGANQPTALPILVQGNYVGLNGAGTASLPLPPAVPGYYGIIASTTYNLLIGGATAGAGNVIGYSGSFLGANLELNSISGTVVQGNFIGTLADGTTPASTNSRGIDSFGASDIVIGATSPGGPGGNVIAGNAQGGILISQGVRNTMFSNSIFGNLVPIDFDFMYSPLPNDHCDADSGTNDLQNYPILASAASNGTFLTISGTLDSTPATAYRVEFFADTAASGQARTPLGSIMVTTDAGCSGAFTATLPFAYAPSMIVRATATDPAGNTSELSASMPVSLVSFSTPALSAWALILLAMTLAATGVITKRG